LVGASYNTRDAPDLGQIKGLKWDLIEDLHVLNAHAMPVNHINDSETRQTTALFDLVICCLSSEP
jgi:hypothetical protein